MTGVEVLVALVILVGLVGVVVPVLPGALLVLAAIVFWAIDESSSTGWAFAVAAVAVLAVGQVIKYTIPGKRLKAGGVPNRSLIVGGLLGIVGFFVIPVVGLFIGFVAGIYLSESQRLGTGPAWASTKSALGAVGLSMLIELAAGLFATAIWIVAVVVT